MTVNEFKQIEKKYLDAINEVEVQMASDEQLTARRLGHYEPVHALVLKRAGLILKLCALRKDFAKASFSAFTFGGALPKKLGYFGATQSDIDALESLVTMLEENERNMCAMVGAMLAINETWPRLPFDAVADTESSEHLFQVYKGRFEEGFQLSQSLFKSNKGLVFKVSRHCAAQNINQEKFTKETRFDNISVAFGLKDKRLNENGDFVDVEDESEEVEENNSPLSEYAFGGNYFVVDEPEPDAPVAEEPAEAEETAEPEAPVAEEPAGAEETDEPEAPVAEEPVEAEETAEPEAPVAGEHAEAEETAEPEAQEVAATTEPEDAAAQEPEDQTPDENDQSK